MVGKFKNAVTPAFLNLTLLFYPCASLMHKGKKKYSKRCKNAIIHHPSTSLIKYLLNRRQVRQNLPPVGKCIQVPQGCTWVKK
ncbi:MAG: hypothetical protein KKH98_01855 [Spirochaetes bacterium]|nr:hypothetical protein [Spirochaetota bacterium]